MSSAQWERAVLLDRLSKATPMRPDDMNEGTPLMRLLWEVGQRIEDLEKSVKAREIQLLDALDEVKALREQVQERDEHIQELQQMLSRAVEAAE
jgi:predicted S18 family serine protease